MLLDGKLYQGMTIKSDDVIKAVTLFAPDTVSCLAISLDCTLLAVAAGDKVHLHSIPAGWGLDAGGGLTANDFPRAATLYMPDRVQSITFSGDGKMLAVAIDDKVHLYKLP